MIVECKGFFDIESKKLIKNCKIFWDKNLKKFVFVNDNLKAEKYLKYAIPVFHDAHVHLFLSGVKNLKQREKELSFDLEKSIEIAKNNIKNLMNYGIFSVVDAGDNKWCALTIRDLNKFKNFKIIASGKALFKKGRYGSFIGLEISDRQSLKNNLRLLLAKGVNVIKVLNSGINSVKEYGKETDPQFSPLELKYIVDFAKDNNLEVLVHVNGKKAISETIKHNVNRLEHAFFIKDEGLIREIANRNIKITPTFRAMYNLIENDLFGNKEKEIIKKTVQTHIIEIKKFLNYGGKVNLGTDSGSFNVIHGRSFIDEIDFFIEKIGFTFEDILSIICIQEFPFLIELEEFSYKYFKKLFLDNLIYKKICNVAS